MPWNPAQPSLGVPQFVPDEHMKHQAGELVPESAAARDFSVESSEAQHQALGFVFQPPRDADNIVAMMLPVGIRGHHSTVWIRGENVRHPGSEGRAFP